MTGTLCHAIARFILAMMEKSLCVDHSSPDRHPYFSAGDEPFFLAAMCRFPAP